jgi:hypothetical protein
MLEPVLVRAGQDPTALIKEDPRMQRWKMQQMSERQLAQFVAANGLLRRGRALLAPEGQMVGRAVVAAQGLVDVVTLEETYTWDCHHVRVWWPGFRPGWSILTVNGDLAKGDLLGPDQVICDVCNTQIVIRPVPVVDGYARCADCFARLVIPLSESVRPYCPLPPDEDAGADR